MKTGDQIIFFPVADECGPNPGEQGLAATVAHVNEDGSVNLSVLNIAGVAHSVMGVVLEEVEGGYAAVAPKDEPVEAPAEGDEGAAG